MWPVPLLVVIAGTVDYRIFYIYLLELCISLKNIDSLIVGDPVIDRKISGASVNMFDKFLFREFTFLFNMSTNAKAWAKLDDTLKQ